MLVLAVDVESPVGVEVAGGDDRAQERTAADQGGVGGVTGRRSRSPRRGRRWWRSMPHHPVRAGHRCPARLGPGPGVKLVLQHLPQKHPPGDSSPPGPGVCICTRHEALLIG